MHIDAYQLCPCQSGKKIKFCCGKEVISDLNQILGNYHSGQTRAALDQIDRTIDRVGAKDCLMVIKTHVLIGAGQMDEAREVNAAFRKNAPEHTMGLQHLAMLEIADAHVTEAINSLQDAIDSVKGEEIPIALANVYRLMAITLFERGQPMASLAHLRFALALKSEDEEDETRNVIEQVTLRTLPLLNQPFTVAPAPEDQPWARLYSNVGRAIARGQFRKALQYLLKIDHENEDHPVVLESMAIVHSFLARDEAADAWRRYAAFPGLHSTRTVEALTIAYELADHQNQWYDFAEMTCELPDFAAATESLLSSPRIATLPIPDESSESPRPRHLFAVLSQPLPDTSGDDLQLSQLPVQWATCAAYGKQTDREARLEIRGVTDDLQQVKSVLSEIIGTPLNFGEPETISQFSPQDRVFSQRLQFPRDTTPDTYERLSREFRRTLLMEQWPKLNLFDDPELTVEQAARDSAHALEAHARVMSLHNNSRGMFLDEEDYRQLIQRLGLAPLEPLNDELDHPRVLQSSVLVASLDFTELATPQLAQMFGESMVSGHAILARRAIREYLKREDRDRAADFENYHLLSRISETFDEAAEALDKCREIAEQESDPVKIGHALVTKLDSCLARGHFDSARQVFEDIRPYLESEHVQFLLTRVMANYGLLDSSQSVGQMQVPAGDPASPALDTDASASPIIADSSAPTESGGKTKLWLPD